MTSEWNYSTINDVCVLVTDGSHSSPKSVHDGEYMVSVKDFTDYGFDFSSCRMISHDDYEVLKRNGCVPQIDDILIGKDGARFFEDIIIYRQREKPALLSSIAILRCDKSKILPDFLYYALRTPSFKQDVKDNYGSGSAIPRIILKDFKRMMVSYPSLEKQRSVISVLTAIDSKIQANTEINDNLEQQAMALYRQMFVENNNDARRECRADEYFDISIGKTPPRKEAQWFSMNPTDCIWVSISDMGRCGMYIADSSEYLTHESVDKFNIKVVPDNTVLLSFKLTVGRVAITDGAMVTNEAIAHFKTDKPEINEYLYCYLKDFNYQTMGSTSSIATAVNSKIIKAMPFVIPTDAELVSFHSATAPMFEMIKTRQRENTRLAELRDSLLPKLMSGEIDVSAVQL
jgi:type I restriction modification DNA specificity domain protein